MSSEKLILVINAGSSSVKFSLYVSPPFDSEQAPTDPNPILQSSISNLTFPPAVFSCKHTLGPSSLNVDSKELSDVRSYEDAFKCFLEYLSNDFELKQVTSGKDITFACHRIVHGGDYERPVVLSQDSLQYLKELTDLAPLYNAPAISLARTTFEYLPKTTNIAFFDTAFHALSIPEHIKIYPLDLEHARCNKTRRYGFHGISYSFIIREVAAYLGKPIEQINIIALHLGSSASACAIQNGESVDNSMDLTPLEGLPGAARSGFIDPSLVFRFTPHASKFSHPTTDRDPQISKAEEILNKHSGWSSLTGTTDFSALTSSSPPPNSTLAFNIFVDRIQDYIGSYFVKLRGEVDALVFAGGIGEKSAELRAAVVDGVQCLGFSLQKRENENMDENIGVVVGIGGERVAGGGGAKVLVCRTDEAAEMARECARERKFWDKI